VPEPSYRQLSQEHPHAFAIGIHDVRTGPSRADELGESVLLCADRGDIQAILHQAPEAQRGVIWVGGARGGFGRPGHGASARLADVLRRDRIASLRLRYRHPNVLPECALDIMAGIASLTHCRAQPVVLVGHSFGGAVVMTAGALHAHAAGVVALAPQTSGATLAGKLAPRPLLWCTAQPTPGSPTRAECRCTTGRRRRNSWSCTRAPSTAWTKALTHWTSCSCSGCPPPCAPQHAWVARVVRSHCLHLWNRWTGPRNVSLSTALEEEGYVDRPGGVCTLYVCRV
jgi:pimeloyl-ACP methyl ester carboxylesterase